MIKNVNRFKRLILFLGFLFMNYLFRDIILMKIEFFFKVINKLVCRNIIVR